MFEKTLGIVLGTVPYNDNTQFVHIYTERFGKVTYKTSIKQRKNGQSRMTFAPMTLLELDVEHAESAELQKIKECSLVSSPLAIGMNAPAKYSQYLFVAELVDKSVCEVEPNPVLWDFLLNSLEALCFLQSLSVDASQDYYTENFHLLFLAKLFTPLGFGIESSNYKKGMNFDMIEGRFTEETILHPYYLNSVSAEYLYNLLSLDYSAVGTLHLTANEKNIMLDILMSFLKIHIPEIGTINSAEVIKTIQV